MHDLNLNYKERDRLLFGQTIDWATEPASVKRFSGAKIETLKDLLDQSFAHPNESQNESPTFADFLAFVEKYPFVTAHGYAVSPFRDDYRVTVEGLEFTGVVSEEVQRDFERMNDSADEFICTSERLFCWFD